MHWLGDVIACLCCSLQEQVKAKTEVVPLPLSELTAVGPLDG